VGYLEGLLTEKVIAESIRFSLLLQYEAKCVCEERAFHWQGIDRILRFQSAINRQLFQAMKELERLQDKPKEKITPPNSSGQEPDVETAGPTTPSDGQNHAPRGELAPVETPPTKMEEAPGPSRVDPLSASTQSATDGQQPASQPRPQAANDGTNPTGAQPGEPDVGAAPRSILDRKPSLADLVSKSAGLPPPGVPTDLAATSRERVEGHEYISNENWGP
jgi:hypothetical protein